MQLNKLNSQAYYEVLKSKKLLNKLQAENHEQFKLLTLKCTRNKLHHAMAWTEIITISK